MVCSHVFFKINVRNIFLIEITRTFLNLFQLIIKKSLAFNVTYEDWSEHLILLGTYQTI